MKKLLRKLEVWWKDKINDYSIDVKSIKLLTAYVLHIDFVCDDTPYYLVIHGDYRVIRAKYLKQNLTEPISFDDYMEEINLLFPSEDVVLKYKKEWKQK